MYLAGVKGQSNRYCWNQPSLQIQTICTLYEQFLNLQNNIQHNQHLPIVENEVSVLIFKTINVHYYTLRDHSL